ncbi:UNVERIFIED_CONTAM: hypothetical protein Sradi_7166900 [Sesamum radiatum]|uniref:Uncharacterized protein n=1 Tax=Sesamum radiatum TaxID=300843 RepID=A0AAW2IVN1_SESRA
MAKSPTLRVRAAVPRVPCPVFSQVPGRRSRACTVDGQAPCPGKAAVCMCRDGQVPCPVIFPKSRKDGQAHVPRWPSPLPLLFSPSPGKMAKSQNRRRSCACTEMANSLAWLFFPSPVGNDGQVTKQTAVVCMPVVRARCLARPRRRPRECPQSPRPSSLTVAPAGGRRRPRPPVGRTR